MACILGIGGVSRSGKSTLAHQIKETLNDKKVLVLDMDDFVYPSSEIPQVADRPDWERPESMDFEQIIAKVKEQQNNFDLIIVEGLFAFANRQLNSLYAASIFLIIDKKTFYERRKEETRWGFEHEWYVKHVWDSYQKFGRYSEADFTFSGETEINPLLLTKVCDNLQIREAAISSIEK